jgi:hypothetical protein
MWLCMAFLEELLFSCMNAVSLHGIPFSNVVAKTVIFEDDIQSPPQ